MTPPVALMANTPPVSTPSNASSHGAGSSGDSSQDFSKPLQQAHRQWTRQDEPAQPAPAKQPSAKTASASSQPQAQTKGKTGAKDDDKSTPPTPDATAAMLALLGQSVPASAAPSAVSTDTDDSGDTSGATAGTSAIATLPATPAGLSLLGAMQAHAPTAATNEFTKAMDGIQDKSLSTLAQGADDDGDTDVATATQNAKGDAFAAALQTLTAAPSKQDDGSDPLEALKNLAATAAAPQPAVQQNAAATPAAHVLTMQSSVGSPAFGQELSQQVTWLGGQDVKEARIRLHPEDLGELDVKVSVKQDHVDVAFIAQHPQAVHAVQQTLTQLDSMLAHHGLSLGQAQVGQGNSGSPQAGSSGGSSSGGESGLGEVAGEVASVVAPVVKAVGLVDMFA
ncbi:flagellar hook-length control protein FliK [Dyella jiangningensis]|uniref:flagellar hook-length control protein FliK n=1 Tax=Dyella sp. AtDHG13 TaxID=1938897 RepID=UPI00088BCD85|nr:flagellar hook-length control protein FliK [Dyella sp. AtDHG13]PXV52600.1 flagellar hook-length control protein FliK [Dyella sp. AtDHG13]SDL52968.1 flagellar hook-length control protein FliK [Dyella jiangningensis]